MAENRKTERILIIFHLLKYCKEVVFEDLTDRIPVSKKTVFRDICLLRQVGFQIEYEKKRKAFVMSQEKEPPSFPENKSRRRYLEKILRLIDTMCNVEEVKDPAVWYREKYPALNVRTMQRDFKILRSIGYVVWCVRGIDERERFKPSNYYCDSRNAWDVNFDLFEHF